MDPFEQFAQPILSASDSDPTAPTSHRRHARHASRPRPPPPTQFEYAPSAAPTTYEDGEGPLLEELGIDPQMILRKLRWAAFPLRAPAPEVASAPEMTVFIIATILLGIMILLRSGRFIFSFLIFLLSFSAISLKVLLSLLPSPEPVSTAIYTAASALGYGMWPQIIMALVALFIPASTLRSYAPLICLPFALFSAAIVLRLVSGMSSHGSLPLLAPPVAIFYSLLGLTALY